MGTFCTVKQAIPFPATHPFPSATLNPSAALERTSPPTGLLSLPPALFRGMREDDLKKVVGQAKELKFKRRDMLFSEGEPVRHVMLLTSGTAKIFQLSSSGDEVILGVIRQGEMVADCGVASGEIFSYSTRALQPCTALSWTLAEFERCAQSFPQIWYNALLLQTERLKVIHEQFNDLATRKTAQRLASTLVRLGRRIGMIAGASVIIGLSQTELAQMTGMTVFTVSRLISEWQDAGIVAGRRNQVVIHNYDSLASFAACEAS